MEITDNRRDVKVADIKSIKPMLEKRRLKVLVIDDSSDSVILMSHILDHYNCDITVAYDGQDAVPLLMNREFDLVVLDWRMPDMGGKETLELIDRLLVDRKVRKLRSQIPVVIYSAHKESEVDRPFVQKFEFVGFVDKRQGYSKMMKSLSEILRFI
nr:response regulator [uncultured Bdellovibrio sp.]